MLFVIVSIGIFYIYFNAGKSTFEDTKLKVENEIIHIYESFDEIISKEKIDIDKLSLAEFKQLNYQMPFDLYVYEGDDLVFWNSNRSVPELNVNLLNSEAKLVSLKNAYYLALKRKEGERTFIALSLIRNSYSLVNKYLRNVYSKQFPFQNSDVIFPAEHSIGKPIMSPSEEVLFRIQTNEDSSEILDFTRNIISITAFLFLYLFFYYIVSYLYNNKSIKFSFFAALVLGFLWFLSISFVPYEFKKYILFRPQLYGASVFTFGSLLVFIFYIFSFYYLVLLALLKNKFVLSIKLKYFLIIFSSVLTVLLAILIRSIILDSVINFGAQNLALLNGFSLLGMLVALFASTTLVFHVILFSFNTKFTKNIALVVTLSSLLSLLLLYYFNFGALSFVLSSLHLIIILVFLFLKLKFKTNIFKVISVSLIFIVFFVSSITIVYSMQKINNNKVVIANNIYKQRDFLTEDLFNNIHFKIKEDPFVANFFIDPLSSYKDLYKRLSYKYFGGYFSKYNIAIIPLSFDGKPIKNLSNNTLEDFYEQINKYSEETLSDELHYIQNNENTYYLSLLQIEVDGSTVGTLALKISPKSYEIGNVYPELLLQGKNKPINQKEVEYEDYAIYINKKLSRSSGEYPYPYHFTELTNKTERKTYNHFVYQAFDNKNIVVSTKKLNIKDSFSFFSFILSFYSLFVFASILFFYFFTTKENQKVFNFSSFRNKINVSMLALVILSFLIMSIATIGYFSKEYNSYHKSRLLRKQNSIFRSLKYIIEKNNIVSEIDLKRHFVSTLNEDLIEISDIHKMDVNIFDLSGNLLTSSQDGIFTSGLLSSKINPKAFISLKNEKNNQVLQDENIDKLKYLAAYIPLYSSSGKIVSYLNIPYFSKEKNLKKDISNFMISLVNVYIFILIIGTIIAFYISNSITNPLKHIGEKLKNISLNKQNEAIFWQTDDEIGALVTVYNKMIVQLEQSVNLLAKKERDEAWREMAKQIAHEIKNPLTPMKLSVQHLQRAIENDKEEALELAQRVSKTLLEQINNLTDIATAFSSFTKMPKAKKDKISLIETLDVSIDLFNEESEIIKKYNIENAGIFADKNQLISVFNNLIKNAIQATEEKSSPLILVTLSLKDSFYLVTVEDNGCGISEDKKTKVFVPNFTTKSSGTGLGLAISKQIIENHKGRIWFKSKENKFTKFFIEIPII